MSNIQGVTLVTLLPTGWARLQKYAFLRVISQRSLSNAIRRFTRGQQMASVPPVYLEALSFIHFGRWIIVNQHPWRSWWSHGLPRFRGQPREASGESIMVFTSNFDFDWRPYVDTFTETAIDDLGVLWDKTPGWQRPSDAGYGSFFEFVDRHKVDDDLYYAAFPNLATANIKSALFVDRAVRSFATQTAGFSEDDWDVAFDRLIAVLQRDLGTIPLPPVPYGSQVFASGGNGNLDLTLLAPVPCDRVGEVQAIIGGLRNDGTSPFALLPGTHFGRLTVIHEVARGTSTMILSSGYILLSVDVDAPPDCLDDPLDKWLMLLYRTWTDYDGGRNLVDEIWGSCWGFGTGRSEDEFVTYMKRTSYPPTTPFADYPHVSLWDVKRAIDTHHWFTALVFGPDIGRRAAVDAGLTSGPDVDPP